MNHEEDLVGWKRITEEPLWVDSDGIMIEFAPVNIIKEGEEEEESPETETDSLSVDYSRF